MKHVRNFLYKYIFQFINLQNFFFVIILSGLLVGCIPKSKIVVNLKNKQTSVPLSAIITNVQVLNNQIIITGNNLSAVSNFQIKEGTTDTTLQIESKNNTSIVANTLSNVTFAAGKVFDFILSNANGASTFTVNFSLCDSSLGGKGFNCLMAPTDKQVLSYDQATGKWKPRSVNGLAYQGTWSALPALPATGVLIPGDYYIVSVANGAYNVGDWIVLNDDGVTFEQIQNSTAVTTVFGRTGNIVATENDYQLDQMGDVDVTTTPAISGDVLLYDGANWVPGVVSAGSGGTVTSVSGTLPISVATGSSTPVVSISQSNTTTNGYLSSTDWNTFNNKQAALPTGGTTLQYYRGDKTLATLNTSVVPENTNLYFTNARALGILLTGFDNTLTGQVAATDSMLQAFGRVQNQINSLGSGGGNYLVKNGADTISGTVSLTNVITATGAGDVVVNSVPLTMTSAVNKTYADGKLDKTAGGVVVGVVSLDNDLLIKAGSNYVTVRGNAATAADYNFVLPVNAGTAGYLLSTDGAGNTSWITASGGGAPTGAASGDLSGNYPNPTITGLDAAKIGGGAVSSTEYSYLDGVTSAIQTQLNSKLSSTLTDGQVLVGNAGNVATAISISGDATIANTGAITLKNTGTAGTYTSVTTDAQGRVTGGTNPVVVTSISGTAPVVVGGTAAVPVISMPAAATAVNGHLTSADWNTFNNKQAAITAASTLNTGSLTSNLQGGLVLNPYNTAAGNTGEIRFNELAANGANYVALKSPDALAGNVVYTLPAADGGAGQILKTDGAGVLSWVTDNSGGGAYAGAINKAVGTDGAGALTTSGTTFTELGYVAGVTSAIQAQINAKETTLTAGTSAQYYRGDKSWQTIDTSIVPENTNLYFTNTRSIASPLTGFATGANSTILATDTVLGAFQKTQGQIAAKEPLITAGAATQYIKGDKSLGTFLTDVMNSLLTGVSFATNSAIVAGDDLLAALGKLQAQITGQATTLGTKADLTNGTQTITALAVTGLSAPVAGSDAANKTYVDSQASPSNSIRIYQARVATTGNITLSGTQTIDGVAVIAGDRVLVKNQTTKSQNGMYVVAAGGWGRATDLDTWAEAVGYHAQVSEGNAWDGMSFVSRAESSGTLGITSLDWGGNGETLNLENTIQGYLALNLNTSGTQNIAIGSYSLLSNLTGYRNTANGYNSLLNNTSGYYNTANGYYALYANTIGTQNTAMGSRALTAITSGSSNIGVGYNSGSAITSGSNNVVIGSNTGSTIATSSNNILISDGAGTERARVDSSGFFGINTTAPGSSLDVKGTLRLSGSTSGYVGFAPAAVAGSTTYTLPSADGSVGQLLKTDGFGVLSWVTDNTGAGAFSGAVSSAVATDGAGALTTVTTTSTELGYVNGVTSSIQTQLNAKQASGNYVTALTGDVTATGPGSVAATVAQVGGVTAANVATGANLANAATNANTASTIVKRDASGNFTAGTITATLNGTATNVTGTVAVANGGTGATTLGVNQLLFGNGTSAVGALATTSTPSILLSAVTTGAPTWTTSTAGNILKGSVTGVQFGALAQSDLPAGSLSGAGTVNYVPYYNATNTLANSPLVVSGTSVGIGTATPGTNTRLLVNGQIAAGVSSITTGAVDFVTGNSVTTTFDCGTSITLANVRSGGNYIIVVTGTGVNQCNFSTTTTGDDAATVSYRFAPINSIRTGNSHTMYSLTRVGNVIYISWITGF
jgi:hypothetical protein